MNTTMDLLADYTKILNEFGPYSREASQYIEDNQNDSEFVELALLSRKLKEALTAPTTYNRANA